MSAAERTVERAAPSLRRRRRRRDERLRARRARARSARSAAPTRDRLALPGAPGRRRRAARRASATPPRTCPRARASRSSTPRPCRPRTPSARAARERGLPERPRAELLAELTALRRTIAVAGTHGKTTTASMLVHALRAAGLEPGWLVGGPVGGGLANARVGRGRVAGRRGRRVRPLDAQPERRDRAC